MDPTRVDRLTDAMVRELQTVSSEVAMRPSSPRLGEGAAIHDADERHVRRLLSGLIKLSAELGVEFVIERGQPGVTVT